MGQGRQVTNKLIQSEIATTGWPWCRVIGLATGQPDLPVIVLVPGKYGIQLLAEDVRQIGLQGRLKFGR